MFTLERLFSRSNVIFFFNFCYRSKESFLFNSNKLLDSSWVLRNILFTWLLFLKMFFPKGNFPRMLLSSAKLCWAWLHIQIASSNTHRRKLTLVRRGGQKERTKNQLDITRELGQIIYVQYNAIGFAIC